MSSGFSWKSWSAVTATCLGVSVLICVSVGAYHWKRTEFTWNSTWDHYHEPQIGVTAITLLGGNNATNDSETLDADESLSVNVTTITTSTSSTSTITSTEADPYDTTEEPEPEVPAVPCNGTEWECDLRLSRHVIPLHYDVYLNPETRLGIFVGRVAMVLDVKIEVDHIRVHMKGLNITHVALTHNRTYEYLLNSTFPFEPNEYYIVRPRDILQPKRYNLIMEFRGNLTRGIVGLYRSTYFDPIANRTKYVVASKFQPTYARRAFPCMDEPTFKSTFSVSLVRPTNATALSNMPVSEEESDKPAKGYTIVHFEKSVKMVSYLVAVAVGDFDYRLSTTKRGVSVKVYSTTFQSAKTEYAMTIVPKMIDFYEEYFQIKYPLPKMDIIGIPDFVSGAMEHWGMISFRESNLLYQPGISAASNRQRIASVLAHEIAHMWFGNLVTLKWWDDLWLNEGFASYMEYKAVNVVHPEWDMESQFVSQDLIPVLKLDGKMSSHPIVQKVLHPDQITEIFDTISYNKGSSVIRMLEQFMGPDKFQLGVVRFLKKFSYNNAVTHDLWGNLQSQMTPDTNIQLMMDTWTRQMGYPVLHVDIKPGMLTIRQERFLENPSAEYNKSESKFQYRWEIPLRIQPGGGNKTFPVQTALMHHRHEVLEIPITRDLTWAKINADQYGYFRVRYSDDVWRSIRLDYNISFSPKERCALMDDVFALAYARYLGYDIALEFAQVIRLDDHLVPWDCLDGHLLQVGSLLESAAPGVYGVYRQYVQAMTSDLYRNFTWTDKDSDSHLTRLLKTKIFSLSCASGHLGCLEMTKSLFYKWINKGIPVPSGIRAIVYKWGMWQYGEDIWNRVWEKFVIELDSQERVRLISALAASQQTWVLRRFVTLAKNESLIRRQDYFTAMRYVALNPTGNPIVWATYRSDYEELTKRFSKNDRYFGRMILDITGDFSTPVQLQEMQSFFATYPDAGAGRRARETALEKVKNNIQWAERNVPVIENWLKKAAENIADFYS